MPRKERIESFCEGCDFAGDVAHGAELAWSSRLHGREVNATVVFDTQLNMSKGIVDMDNSEVAPSLERISKLCTQSCLGGCALEQARLMAIDYTDDLQRAAMLGLLNSYPGVSKLGEVIFDADEDDGDTIILSSDTPNLVVN